MTLPIQDSVAKDGVHNYWRLLCYVLHAFLVGLHLALLGVGSIHVEHRTIISDNETVTIGLSAGLQAFYTIYTALLVFVTQRLMLSDIFSSPKKLTQIHDICGAWGGFGAALNTLWQQIKVASSVWPIALVTVYFACVSVLHVASSTIIQLQLFNNTITMTAAAAVAFPDASVDLGSLDWATVTTLVPFLQTLYGNTTNGLTNNTLYDVPTQSFVNATVNATTLHANCGLLTGLSINPTSNTTWNVSVSMPDLGPINITISYPPLFNEIWLSPSIECSEPICSTFILYLVSAAMEVDDSVTGVTHVYVNGTYSPGGVAQNFSTPVYFVACSLNETTRTVTIGASGYQLNSNDLEPTTDVAWSAYSSGGNANLTSGISLAMTSANSGPLSPYCQPIISNQSLWANATAFNAYTISLLGIGLTNCNGSGLAQYNSAPSMLTRAEMENGVSQIATEFLWLAGELGAAGGGFDRQMGDCRALEYVLQWRLNINLLPVIFSLCASAILFVLVVCILWGRRPALTSAAGVLEIMWIGSHSQVLRDHLRRVQIPSMDNLRTSSMFETTFWTRSAHVYGNKERGAHYAAVPLYDVYTGSFKTPASSGYEPGDPHSSDLYQSKSRHTPNTSRRRRWCYALHVVFVALHVILLGLLVHHPEHSVIIANDSSTMTVGLSAFLQAAYTLYSTILVLITQQLASFKVVNGQRKLTTVHDVSGAWTGIGAAIYALWQQHKVSSSALEVTAVVIYLTAMLVLHIASSSVIQWQAFGTTLLGVLPTELALPDSTVDVNTLGWIEIFPIAFSLGQDNGLSTYGLSNSTIYDMPQVSNNVSFSMVSVNATTFNVQCGLVPNLTLTGQHAEGKFRIDFLNEVSNGTIFVPPIWKDVVYSIYPFHGCSACAQTLFYLITTGIDADPSILDPAVELNWTYTPPGGNPQTSFTLAYVAACSLSANTIPATLDLQTDKLIPAAPVQPLPANTSWPSWSPGNATQLSVGMATGLSEDITSWFSTFPQGNNSAWFTAMDNYTMTLLGLNLTAANSSAATQSSADPSMTLGPWQLENVLAQTGARFLWLAGQLGQNGGGFERDVGDSQAMAYTVQWRLNVNTIPVLFAFTASLVALVLAIFLTLKSNKNERSSLASVSGTSVLECLWLEAQSDALHTRLQAVEASYSDALRKAGMFDVCLGNIHAGQLGSTEPEVMRPILESGAVDDDGDERT